jgi:hypothetical protein
MSIPKTKMFNTSTAKNIMIGFMLSSKINSFDWFQHTFVFLMTFKQQVNLLLNKKPPAGGFELHVENRELRFCCPV